MQKDNKLYEKIKLICGPLARTWIKLWIFITFLPNKLGNNDQIVGQTLPNIDFPSIMCPTFFLTFHWVTVRDIWLGKNNPNTG